MFEAFDKINYNSNKVTDQDFIIIGQVCIDKQYRGQGIFDKCYAAYQEFYGSKYDFAITEIANTNTRSLHVHKRLGFREIDSYIAPDKTVWVVVVWDWR
jgi:ribosomal protein S18 acetylase RimI-like enzyme